MSLKASSANCGLCICGAWPLAEVMKKTQRKPEARSQKPEWEPRPKPGSHSGFWLLASGFLCVFFMTSASGQTPQTQRPQLAEEAFKDIQILRGIPVDEFMDTMGFISASL